MLIKSLYMKNFRQFMGETKVEFATEPGNNITVILGNNTFGKTTLLQAFNWCFYEKVLFSDNPDDLLNYEVASKSYIGESAEVEVTIELLHDGENYTISRKQKNTKKNNGFTKQTQAEISFYHKDESGKTIPASFTDPVEIKKLINTILPEDLSKYFFFDTERVNSISTKKDVAEAVKGLLGLSALNNAIKHIGAKSNKHTSLGLLYDGMEENGNKEAKAVLDNLHQADERKRQCIEEIATYDNEIKYYENRKSQLEEILRDNRSTAELQAKKQKFENDISIEESSQKSMMSLIREEFFKKSLGFYAIPLMEQAEAFLKAVDIDDKGITDLTKPTLLELLNRGRCICGCELIEGNDAYNHILMEMKYVPPESIGNTVRNYINEMHTKSKDSKSLVESINTFHAELYRSKTRVVNYVSELEEISEEIKGSENMRQHEIDLQDVKGRLKDLHIKRDKAVRNEVTAENDIQRYQRIYDTLMAKSAKYDERLTYIRYAEEILDWLSETYEEKESYIRDALEDRVNSIFERMYHGKRRVVIDKKFNVELLTVVSNREMNTGKSEGLDRVKNFAFIGGLVALAKDKIISKAGEQEIDLASEPYPLVMDAPFSNADEEHTGNISRVLPEVAEQVIMFVMEKDFRIAEPVMRSRIGKRFKLTKISETHTILE